MQPFYVARQVGARGRAPCRAAAAGEMRGVPPQGAAARLVLPCAAAAAWCGGGARAQQEPPSLQGVQVLAINEQGNGWYRSVSSKRQDGNSSAFPMELTFSAAESGMMSYYEMRSGLVLTFAMNGWDPSTHDAFLSVDWSASASPASGFAVVRVDQTSCGAQRNDVRLFHRDCVAHNTGSCDSHCYCSVVPCVLEASLAGNKVQYPPDQTKPFCLYSLRAGTQVAPAPSRH